MKRLTLLIVRKWAASPMTDPTLSDKAKMLLIRRSRIAKKASAKIGLAAEVPSDAYEPGQRWLVLRGQRPPSADDGRSARSPLPVEYHTGMDGDRAAARARGWFRNSFRHTVSIERLDGA